MVNGYQVLQLSTLTASGANVLVICTLGKCHMWPFYESDIFLQMLTIVTNNDDISKMTCMTQTLDKWGLLKQKQYPH